MNYFSGTVSKKKKLSHITFKVLLTDTIITKRKEKVYQI
jgi:hypothetical protein